MNAKLYEEESVEILKIYGIIGNIEYHQKTYNHGWIKFRNKPK